MKYLGPNGVQEALWRLVATVDRSVDDLNYDPDAPAQAEEEEQEQEEQEAAAAPPLLRPCQRAACGAACGAGSAHGRRGS